MRKGCAKCEGNVNLNPDLNPVIKHGRHVDSFARPQHVEVRGALAKSLLQTCKLLSSDACLREDTLGVPKLLARV
jgi:hypothetical protein